MMDYMNQVISVVVKLVITGAGTAFIAYGIPYLKQIGMYKICLLYTSPSPRDTR